MKKTLLTILGTAIGLVLCQRYLTTTEKFHDDVNRGKECWKKQRNKGKDQIPENNEC